MRAGRRNKRITLQSATETPDAHGQPVKTWVYQDKVWAEVRPLSGREREIANQAAAEVNVAFTILWRSDITSDWRVVYDGSHYEIVEPIPPDNIRSRRDGLTLMCRRVS